MTKGEFLDTLARKLSGEVSPTEMSSSMEYYRDYIEEAIASGRTEEEVLAELGSPILIAKSIIEVARERESNGKTPYEQAYDQYSGNTGGQEQVPAPHGMNLATKVVIAAIIVLLVIIIFTTLRALLPVLVPVLVIYLVYRLITGGRR